MELARRKEDRTSCQAFEQDECLGLFFKSKFFLHRLFQVEFQC